MKTCPLCGSVAVAWPDVASDYVRGYPLCEYHMGLILKKAHIFEYNTQEHLAAKKYNAMRDELIEAIEDITEKNYYEVVGEQYTTEHGHCAVAWGFYRDAYDGIDEKPLVHPSREYIDDAEVDRLIALRLIGLSKEDGRVHRCSAFREERPDQRCTHRVYREGDFCPGCTKSNQVRNGGFEQDSIRLALDTLRCTSKKIENAA